MRLLLLLSVILFTNISHAQLIKESIYSYSNNYWSNFNASHNALEIKYIKEFSIRQLDTIKYVTIEINNSIEVTTNCSSCIAGTCSLNQHRSKTAYNSTHTLNKEDFNALYSCIENMYNYINSKQVSNTKSECSDKDFVFGSQKERDISYYFSKNDTNYKLNQKRFLQVINLFKKIRKEWR